ncbi:MAG TPA: sialidase family protein, partial [Spirochaetia bacterium]|nr:sialidase family protein [Spirochaetia bacterium]
MMRQNTLKAILTIFSLLFAFFWSAPLFGEDFYWEEPYIPFSAQANFSQVRSGGGLTVCAYQEIRRESEERGSATISIAVSEDGRTFKEHRNVAGPFSFVGKETEIFSLAVGADRTIYLALMLPDNTISIYSSTDQGFLFHELYRTKPFTTTVAPRVFVKADGGLLLFVSQGLVRDEVATDTLAVYYAVSKDGRFWSDFAPLTTEEGLLLSFLPHHVSFGGREYVAFQVYRPGTPSTFQLYLTLSEDGGRTWGKARLIT